MTDTVHRQCLWGPVWSDRTERRMAPANRLSNKSGNPGTETVPGAYRFIPVNCAEGAGGFVDCNMRG